MDERPEAVIFDVDGTLALRGDRDPYDWSSAGADKPNGPVVRVLHALARSGIAIVYVSGRVEDARSITENWIDREIGVGGRLYLRRSGDTRRDAIVKRELHDQHIRNSFTVLMVFDDRNQVVRMWRDELSLPCFQVADGDF